MYRIQPIHHTNNQVNLNKYKKTDVMSHLMGIETDMENHLKRTNTEKTYSEETFKKEERKLHLISHKYEIMIACIYGMVCLHMFIYLYNAIQGLYHLNLSYLHINVFVSMLWLILPICTWIWSTAFDEYNFHNRKIAGIYLSIINLSLLLENILQYLLMFILIPIFLKIPISIFITENMIVYLSRFLIFLLSVVPAIGITYFLCSLLTEEDTRELLINFRIKDYVDLRPFKEYAYDLRIVRRLDNGDMYTIKEKDRSLHTMYDGTTGTGKTSSCITTSTADDLDQRLKNEAYQKKVVVDLLEKGHARLREPFSDKYYNLNKIEALDDKGKSVINKLYKHIYTCGITILAPNASLADDVFELADVRGIPVNRIDPTLNEDGTRKKGFIGFNPLYISPVLTPFMRNLEIVKKARTFADVLQALYEMGGSSDTYFTSLNRNVNTSVCIIILITWPSLHKKNPHQYPGEQPTLIAIQDVINDFSRVKPYRDEYMELITRYSDEERGFKRDTYQFVIDLIDNDLLGVGALQMQNQARGLRNIINEFLTNPLFKDTLCCEDTIDMDALLSEGQITVVNYALELGKNDAIAFGLFFALSFNNAVFRRPSKNRIPNFFSIDEFPVILHPALEQCFTMYRQYNVPMSVAIQTLDQMEKSDTTRYLKGVLLGNCAHQFIFGRISTTEMKLYETMGGTHKESVEQNSVTETPLSLDTTSMSFQTRTSMQDTSLLQGGKMRGLHFQEVTVFTVNDGSPVEPFYGKVSFLKESKKLKREPFHVDWSQYFNTVENQSLVQEYLKQNKKKQGVKNEIFTSAGNIRFGAVANSNHTAQNLNPGFLNAGSISIGTGNTFVNEKKVENAANKHTIFLSSGTVSIQNVTENKEMVEKQNYLSSFTSLRPEETDSTFNIDKETKEEDNDDYEFDYDEINKFTNRKESESHE